MRNRRQELIDNLEEARLALWMDQYAEVYGQICAEEYAREEAAGTAVQIDDRDLEAGLEKVLRRAEREQSAGRRGGQSLRKFFRNSLSAVAVAAVFFLLGFSAHAVRDQVLGLRGYWNEDSFYFDTAHTADAGDLPASPSLSEKLGLPLHCELPGFLFPDALPKDFSVVDLRCWDGDELDTFSVCLENGEESVTVNILATHEATFNSWYGKDAREPEIHVINGMTYYILSNENAWVGAWSNGSYELIVSDTRGRDSLLEILRTIGGTMQ